MDVDSRYDSMTAVIGGRALACTRSRFCDGRSLTSYVFPGGVPLASMAGSLEGYCERYVLEPAYVIASKPKRRGSADIGWPKRSVKGTGRTSPVRASFTSHVKTKRSSS